MDSAYGIPATQSTFKFHVKKGPRNYVSEALIFMWHSRAGIFFLFLWGGRGGRLTSEKSDQGKNVEGIGYEPRKTAKTNVPS